jgi:hypothetical protein
MPIDHELRAKGRLFRHCEIVGLAAHPNKFEERIVVWWSQAGHADDPCYKYTAGFILDQSRQNRWLVVILGSGRSPASCAEFTTVAEARKYARKAIREMHGHRS